MIEPVETSALAPQGFDRNRSQLGGGLFQANLSVREGPSTSAGCDQVENGDFLCERNLRAMLECLLVVASLCSWPQTGVFNPRQVEMQIRRGDFEEASATLEDELTRNPSDFEAHLLLGIVRQEQGKPDEATSDRDCEETAA